MNACVKFGKICHAIIQNKVPKRKDFSKVLEKLSLIDRKLKLHKMKSCSGQYTIILKNIQQWEIFHILQLILTDIQSFLTLQFLMQLTSLTPHGFLTDVVSSTHHMTKWMAVHISSRKQSAKLLFILGVGGGGRLVKAIGSYIFLNIFQGPDKE